MLILYYYILLSAKPYGWHKIRMLAIIFMLQVRNNESALRDSKMLRRVETKPRNTLLADGDVSYSYRLFYSRVGAFEEKKVAVENYVVMFVQETV